jgi:sialic acid synthase SpsE/sugar phosphate isomerase/epimerase
MPEIKIGERLIGDNHPTYIIAEIGVNHNGILALALELIDIAVDAGADAVKFQKRNLEQLYAKKYLDNANAGEKTLRYLLPILQQVELSNESYYQIVDHCRRKGITFLASAFDSQSADFLDQLDVPAYKVASADLTNLPLLEHLLQKNKPLILSTGMSRMEEVETTVAFLKERSAEFALLHCNSTYPTAFEDINLRFMFQLRRFGVPVGYSGHERGIAVSTVASALGASILERHLTLDRTMEGPDHAASLEPQGFQKMVRDIRQVSMAMGTGEEKFLSRGEILNREVLGKSLVATRRILPGETITRELVTVKGPALGVSPQNYTLLLGRIAERIIEEDEPFTDHDLGIRIKLDTKQLLPMDYGFTVRFRDYQEVLPYQPRMLEFHFTDQDLDEARPGEDLLFSEELPFGEETLKVSKTFRVSDLELKLVVHAPEFWERTLVDLCSLDERQRSGSRALMQKTIDLTRSMAPHFIGVPKVVIHPGAMSLDHPIREKQALYDNLRRSVVELDCTGVELLLENLPPHPWYFGGQWLTNAFMDAYEIRDFISAEGLGMCYDTSHHKLYCNWAQQNSNSDVDFYDQVQVLLPYIRHLHLADGAGLDGEGLQIGEGTIDWVRLFRQLGDYHGTMIPEIWRGHQRNGEGFLIALERLSQAYFKAQRNPKGLEDL